MRTSVIVYIRSFPHSLNIRCGKPRMWAIAFFCCIEVPHAVHYSMPAKTSRKRGGSTMTAYRQEMAAILCMYESGTFDVVSCHYTAHNAREALAYMRESGEADTWHGRLFVVDNGIVHAQVNVGKLMERLEAWR